MADKKTPEPQPEVPAEPEPEPQPQPAAQRSPSGDEGTRQLTSPSGTRVTVPARMADRLKGQGYS